MIPKSLPNTWPPAPVDTENTIVHLQVFSGLLTWGWVFIVAVIIMIVYVEMFTSVPRRTVEYTENERKKSVVIFPPLLTFWHISFHNFLCVLCELHIAESLVTIV